MSEVDEAIERLEKYRKSTGLYKGQPLTLELQPTFFSLLGKGWEVRLTVGSFPYEIAHKKTFFHYKSALKHYEELRQKYGLEEKRR